MRYMVNGTSVPVSFLVMGPIQNNVYIVGDGKGEGKGKGCFVVDPSCEAELILKAIGERPVWAIVITHGHWDHTGAAADLREATGAPVIASAVDAPSVTGENLFPGHTRLCTPCPVDRTVQDGDVLQLGAASWQVIATPGHTLGSMCLFLDSPDADQGAPVLLSGDTLFAGAHGRVDFPESDPAAMRASLKRLAQLPPETIVLPGHEDLTTIEREADWLRRGGFEL